MSVPADFVCVRRRCWVVDSNLDLVVSLQLFNLRQTFTITMLVKHHWALQDKPVTLLRHTDSDINSTPLNSSLLTNGSRMAKRNTVHKNKSNGIKV